MPPLKVHFLQPGVEEFKEIQIRPETKQVLDKIVHLFECFRFCIFGCIFICVWIYNSIILCVCVLQIQSKSLGVFKFNSNFHLLSKLEPVLSITKDGIENTFKEITIITTIK